MKTLFTNTGRRAKLLTLAMSLVVALGLAIVLGLSLGLTRSADAAVQNYPPGVQVIPIPFHISGTVSATTAGVVKFNMPFPCRVIGVGAVPRALTGTGNTLDVLLGGTSILSAPIAMTAGTYTEGTVTTSAITDEGAVTVNVTVPAGTLVDTTVLITVVRR